jgi:hypothetical protein
MSKNFGDYEDLREKWTHEDDLINHRITWLLLSQTLLFTAYGIFLQTASQPDHLASVDKLIPVIPLIGFAVSIIIMWSIGAALASMRFLRKQNKEIVAKPNTGIGGFLPPILLPIVFLLSWIYVVVAYCSDG